jgi:4-alpha-glucanotransferase
VASKPEPSGLAAGYGASRNPSQDAALGMSALDSLSDYCGILRSYVDARGETQIATPQSRQALLAAMGISSMDEQSARRALGELRAREAAQLLPPVHVHYQASGPVEIGIRGAVVAQAIHWRIELENGDVRQGRMQEALTADGVLRIEEQLPDGYHTLTVGPAGTRCSLIVTPGHCWLPGGVNAGRRFWGVAVQLYLLRSNTNWGIGDYGDLQRLVRLLASRGADAVGLNPLHALFADDPETASPYSPASRLLLNILNIDVAQLVDSIDCAKVRDLMNSDQFRQALTRCREAAWLDYSGTVGLKMPVLEALYGCCDQASPEWQSFEAFRAAADTAFERGCLFLALRKRFAEESADIADWHRWPEAFRRADSPATQRFAQESADAVTFQAWLQFVADSQLRECSEAAGGMAIGLYRDLAVGANRAGAETWANPTAVVDGAQVGAPPDIYNPQGQDWGLPPFNPRALRAEGYRSFIELVRANMRHAGGLRIDHVMALQQLYWVPTGRSAADGAYVRYPLEDLVGILALESQRHQCLVVGEDLGTVPEGFRERMERANILSYRVLFFEKDSDGFIAPEEYPRLALAVASSHDLPTLRGWWQASDLKLKEDLDLFPTEAHAAEAMAERKKDRDALEVLLRHSRLIDTSALDADRFADAAHTLLGRARSMLTLLQLDDLTGEVEPVNVPTTLHEYPNWRRRISVSVEQLAGDRRFVSSTAAVAAERNHTPANPDSR